MIGTILTIGLIGLGILLLITSILIEAFSDYIDGVGFFCNGILSLVLGIFLLISIPLTRLKVNMSIAEFNAFKETIELREESIENAALKIKIAEWNEQIARTKYVNKYFNWWIPEAFDELEMIK